MFGFFKATVIRNILSESDYKDTKNNNIVAINEPESSERKRIQSSRKFVEDSESNNAENSESNDADGAIPIAFMVVNLPYGYFRTKTAKTNYHNEENLEQQVVIV